MLKSINSFLEYLLFFALIAVCVLLATNANYSLAVTNGINLWIACVLPSLFPYFFITAILSGLKITGKISNSLSPITTRFFNTNGATGYAFLMSVISGYPMGAKLVSDLKTANLISDAESVRASVFCSTSSPMFILGSVGNFMFKSTAFAFTLYLTHILSAIIAGVIFSFYKRKEKPIKTTRALLLSSHDNILYESAFSAVISVLVVGGLITVFYLVTEILLSIGVLSPVIDFLTTVTGHNDIANGLTLGAFECTRGLKALSIGGINFLTLPTAAFICGFGGLSVIAQSIAHLKKAKIKTAPFIFSKLLSAVINFILGLIFSLTIL